jgi:geranylgeranyl diphosphate synthase, type I
MISPPADGAGHRRVTGRRAAILAAVKVVAAPTMPALPAAELFRAMVDDELRRFLAEQRALIGPVAREAGALVDEASRLLDAGGKRIRPLFCYWGYRAGGGTDLGAVVRAGAAVELVHTAALIHDDLIDGSPLRRGVETSARRLGTAGAVLAGDVAQVLADALLAASGAPPTSVLAATVAFNRMRLDAVAGEFMDLRAADAGRTGTEDEARRVGALKSGSYTVVGPLSIGAALAGAPSSVTSTLRRFGLPLGEAFQIRDDVLGTFGDPAVTGKDRDGDIRDGKQTVLVAKARRLAEPAKRERLSAAIGRPDLAPEEVEEVRSIIRDSGALAETIALIDALAVQAKGSLAGGVGDPEVRGALEALADLVVLRDA